MKYEIKKLLDVFEVTDGRLHFNLEHIKNKTEEYNALSDLIHSLAEDMDEDSAYTWTRDALQFIEDNSQVAYDDLPIEFESEVNIYTSDLTAWLARSTNNVEWLHSALEHEPENGSQLLVIAQGNAMNHVMCEVINKLLID